VEVIDALLDVVMAYSGAPSSRHQQQQQQAGSSGRGAAAMDLDQQSPQAQQQQGQQAAAATAPAAAAAPPAAAAGDTVPLPADLLLRKLEPMAREVGIQAMVLRLLGDYCLLYNNTVGLLLKRDSESDTRATHAHSHHSASTPLTHASHDSGATGAAAAAANEGRTPARRGSTRHPEHSSSGGSAAQHDSHKAGAVLKHVLHVQLMDPLPPWGPSAGSVSANASSLLQAVCIRSSEGRRRILTELVATLNSSIQGTQQQQEKQEQEKQQESSCDGALPPTVSVGVMQVLVLVARCGMLKGQCIGVSCALANGCA
jgi:hypothetical protein